MYYGFLKTNTRSIALLLLLLAVRNASSATGSVEELSDWIDEHVPAMMRDSHMPGVAIAVVKNGEIVYAEGFGARDSERSLPATPDTLFGIGSITKSFVAIAILQLVEQGKLDLDDPVSKYIPFELGFQNNPIRIRHFLTHTQGFPSLATSTVLLRKGLGADTGVPMASAEDFYRFVNDAGSEVIFEPGEYFFYNNAAWRMLGAIIQEVSGMSFDDYVTEEIIQPLQMTRTTLDSEKMLADPDHMIPHHYTGGAPEPSKFPYAALTNNPEFSFVSAAGGIVSSANDMARYLNMLIALGQVDEGRVLDERLMQLMQDMHIREPDDYYGENGYGFGLHIVPNFFGRKMLTHGGSVIVSTARIAFIPEERIGVVILGNSWGMDFSTICDSILAILIGKKPAEDLPSLLVQQRMEHLTGKYAIYKNLNSIEVVQEHGVLYIKSSESRRPLIPNDLSYSDLTFYTLDGGQKHPVIFRSDEDGQMSILIDHNVFHKE